MKNEKQILKWFNGELSASELEAFKKTEDYKSLDKIAHYSSQLEAPVIDPAAALREFRNRQEKITKKESKSVDFKMFFKVAAVVMLMLTSSYFLFFNNQKTYTTSLAQSLILQLPDQSDVTLNAESELSFNKKAWKTERSLDLEGEAFFKVKKGEKFTVKTDKGMIQVLGTQFNVKTRDHYFEVQCYEGSVKVSNETKEVVLKPGESFRVINDTYQEVETFATDAPAWLNNETTLTNVPLNLVLDELKRHYDVQLILKDTDSAVLFTGTFTHSNLHTALQSITIPLKLAYKIENKTVTIYDY